MGNRSGHDNQILETHVRDGIAVVTGEPAMAATAGKYQRLDGEAGDDNDEGCHLVFRGRSRKIACPCPCPCLSLALANHLVYAIVVAHSSDQELALNRSVKFLSELACASKAMGIETGTSSGWGFGNADHGHASAGTGRCIWNYVWYSPCLLRRGHEGNLESGSSWLVQKARGQRDR